MTRAQEEKIISEVAKSYNLTTSPPDISDPEVINQINEEVIAKCVEDLEAADRAESASRAHAHEIWTW